MDKPVGIIRGNNAGEIRFHGTALLHRLASAKRRTSQQADYWVDMIIACCMPISIRERLRSDCDNSPIAGPP